MTFSTKDKGEGKPKTLDLEPLTLYPKTEKSRKIPKNHKRSKNILKNHQRSQKIPKNVEKHRKSPQKMNYSTLEP